MRIMAIATLFVALIMTCGAVSAADSNAFTNVNMANSGPLNFKVTALDEDPLLIQGTMAFKGIQYDDYAAVKVKWTDAFPGAGAYLIDFDIGYIDKFGDIENQKMFGLFVQNGTQSTSRVLDIGYMDLSKTANITVNAYKYSDIGPIGPFC